MQDTQVERLLVASVNQVSSCPACPSRQESVCSLMQYTCTKLRLAKELGHRVYIYGLSGSGKTTAVNQHFNEYRTFLPFSSETFGFDGFDSRLHSAIFFDEFKVYDDAIISALLPIVY